MTNSLTDEVLEVLNAAAEALTAEDVRSQLPDSTLGDVEAALQELRRGQLAVALEYADAPEATVWWTP